jgi:hypothetical protein
MLKKIVLLLIAVLLVACQTPEKEVVETIPEETSTVYNRVIIVSDEVKLYKDTNEFSLVGVVYKDSVYDVLEVKESENKTWLSIKVGTETEGWIDASYSELSSLEPVEYTSAIKAILDIEEHYLRGEQLLIKDFVVESGSVKVEYYDKVVVNDVILYDIGDVSLKLHYYDTLGRLIETENRIITVYDEIKKLYFEQDDTSSKRLGIKDELKAFHEKNLIYVLEKNELWVETMHDNKKVYYLESPEDISRFTSFNQVSIKQDDVITMTETDVQVDLSILENDYIIYFAFSESRVVNIKTGNSYDIKGDYILSDDGQSIMIYKALHRYEDSLDDRMVLVKVVTLEPNKIIEVYEDINGYIGIDNVKASMSTFSFDAYNFTIDEWHYAPETYAKKSITLSDTDGWQEELIHNDYDHINPYQSALVYSEPNQKSSSIGVYNVEELSNIRFLDMYDIAMDDLVLWYEVSFSDNSKGYIYRPRLENETGAVERDKDIYFIRSNSGLIKENKLGHLTYGTLTVSDILAFNNMYFIQSYFEGYGITVYSRLTGEEVPLRLTEDYSLSEDKSRILGREYLYGSEYPVLRIYKILEDRFELEYELDSKDYFPSYPEWISNTEVSFKSNRGQGEEIFIITYNEEWILNKNE